MVLSVIMPTYKRLNVLTQSYQALLEAVQKIDAQIIIVNDDKETTAQRIADYINANIQNTVVVNNNKTGVAAARNMGASLAGGHLLLFLDDDVIIQEKNILKIIALHQQFSKIILSPTWIYTEDIQRYFESTPFGLFRLKYDFPLTVPRGKKGNEVSGYKHLYYDDALSAFCLSVKREAYLELNGMDESFPFAGAEDQEFTARAKRSGYKLLIDTSNVLYHNESHRLDPEAWLQRQYSGVQGFVIYAMKYPEKKQSALWYENTPVSDTDSFKLKFKKLVKTYLINSYALTLIKLVRVILEKIHAPYFVLQKVYLLQTGLYIHKGFIKSYKKHCQTNPAAPIQSY
jgi:GT2 family glycosyltransferase